MDAGKELSGGGGSLLFGWGDSEMGGGGLKRMQRGKIMSIAWCQR